MGDFEYLIQKIKEVRPIQEGNITGVSKDKREARRKVSRKAIVIAERLYAFASITGNNKLKERVAIRPSEFDTCRDTVVCDYINIIFNAAGQYVSELAKFNVTQEDLDELNRLNDEYSVIIENPRQAVTNKSRVTKYLTDYFKQSDIILKERLDKLMNYFRENSPDFWHQYKSARKIIDLGHRKRAERPAESQADEHQKCLLSA